MNTCQNCTTENKENDLYCHNCGAQLLFRCAACQKMHLPNLKFCPNTGKNISQAESKKKAEQLQKQQEEQREKEHHAKHGLKIKWLTRAVTIVTFVLGISFLPFITPGENNLGAAIFLSVVLSLPVYMLAEVLVELHYRKSA